ncbi:MAG: glycosyltransferase family 4 protein [Proteobacteria bacterium]|nr:glycosyltransferase family 4 protein [Pseudomonadota bacterium]
MTTLNITILRFAHAFDSGGGTETYIEDLDRMLLANNSWTIIRMYLTYDKNTKSQQHEIIGKGNLIKVPLYAENPDKLELMNIESKYDVLKNRLKNLFRDQIIYNPLLYSVFFQSIIQKRPIPKRINEALNAKELATELMSEHKIDLVVMHYASGSDSAAVIEAAIQRDIPYVFINHFSNDCLNSVSVREQTKKAAGIGGVSKVGVPKRLRNTFYNISDGIDINIFKNTSSKPNNDKKDTPIILLPARITPSKGQHDLIRVCANLRNEGVRCQIALAGRADSESYIKKLKNMANKLGVGQDVLFLGLLSSDQLREWYDKSSIMAFPTYHNEGLGRVLIEAQAMKVPPVSYIIGGTPEAIIHGKTGFLVKKGDISDFAARLKELLNDANKRRHMGEAGREFVVRQFSLQALAIRHEKFYLKAISKVSRKF